MTYHGKVTKTGSKYLRWIILDPFVHISELIRMVVSHNFYERLSKKKGFPNAAVAAASKPLKIVYWVMKERRGYQPRPTPSPSSSSPRDLYSTS
jgi:hypothetical protein